MEGNDGILYQIQLNKKSLIRIFPDKKQMINSSFKELNNEENEDKIIAILRIYSLHRYSLLLHTFSIRRIFLNSSGLRFSRISPASATDIRPVSSETTTTRASVCSEIPSAAL